MSEKVRLLHRADTLVTLLSSAGQASAGCGCQRGSPQRTGLGQLGTSQPAS